MTSACRGCAHPPRTLTRDTLKSVDCVYVRWTRALHVFIIARRTAYGAFYAKANRYGEEVEEEAIINSCIHLHKEA